MKPPLPFSNPCVALRVETTQSIRAQAATFLVALLQCGTGGVALAQTAKEPSLPYTVKSTDTMSRFSREVLVSQKAWQEVAMFNQLKDANVLSIGQQINIPVRLLKSTPASGKVISAEGNVTSKNGALQVGSAITDGSTIQTGANSSAVIEMGDGSRIKILPNSLAEVVVNRNYALKSGAGSSSNWFSGLMRLTQGTLEAVASKLVQRATPLQIETPTSLVGVRGTSFRVAFDDPTSKSARTEVIEGKVRADNPAQGVGADLPLGTGAVIKPLEKDVKVALLLPAPDLSAVSSDVLKPLASFVMPTLAGASAYRLQVSSDEKFDKIVRDLKVNTAAADLSTLPNGSWFARVRGIDAAGLEGFDSIKLIAVKDGEWRVTDSSISLVNGKAVLSWAGQLANGQVMAADGFTAILASDAALTQNSSKLDGPAAQASVVLGDLKPGIYYIRLQASTGPNKGLSSQTYRFELSGNWGQTVFAQTFALQAVR
jgi:hypothetical protein